MNNVFKTPIQSLGKLYNNQIFIKREDMIPYSFGGNKARKARLFFQEIDNGDYDTVVTYGSSHSNHCRIVANMAAARKMQCILIGPDEVSDTTFNSRLMNLLGAKIITVPVSQVHDTIERVLDELKQNHRKPYFISGGGHGNLGTKAYVECYEEIKDFEAELGVYFDYIVFATGTGTTQAGLVYGQLSSGDQRKIIGISIARNQQRGRPVVLDSIKEYAGNTITEEQIEKATIFVDDYIGDGYGTDNHQISLVINEVFVEFGIPLDATYTGKAFWGMKQFLQKEKIENKNVLFIHTGGTPLFFDELQESQGEIK